MRRWRSTLHTGCHCSKSLQSTCMLRVRYGGPSLGCTPGPRARHSWDLCWTMKPARFIWPDVPGTGAMLQYPSSILAGTGIARVPHTCKYATFSLLNHSQSTTLLLNSPRCACAQYLQGMRAVAPFLPMKWVWERRRRQSRFARVCCATAGLSASRPWSCARLRS